MRNGWAPAGRRFTPDADADADADTAVDAAAALARNCSAASAERTVTRPNGRWTLLLPRLRLRGRPPPPPPPLPPPPPPPPPPPSPPPPRGCAPRPDATWLSTRALMATGGTRWDPVSRSDARGEVRTSLPPPSALPPLCEARNIAVADMPVRDSAAAPRLLVVVASGPR